MTFEHGSQRPTNLTEDWDGQYTFLPWMSFVSAIPHVIFIVTTLKENGLPNAGLEGWSCFCGEGDHYYAVMTGLGKDAHTYRNIKRTGEFCINFLSAAYVAQCKESIRLNGDDNDEIADSGFTAEPSHTIQAPRIGESFLKLECHHEWDKELSPNSINRLVCGEVRHISVSEGFARSSVTERYGDSGFMFHLMAMKDPFSDERLRGGIGRIEMTREMDI